MNSKTEGRRYLAMGWSVFRLQPGTKLPAGRWAEFHTRRADPSELADWAPSANVAIVTGSISGIAVVDFDAKKGVTEEFFRAFVASHPTGRLAQTPSGGWHAYYALPEGLEVHNSVDMIARGVDVRGEGGFVAAPPSKTDVGAYVWLNEGELGAFPAKYASRPTEKRNPNPAGWVEKLLAEGVREGGRDNATAQLAGWAYARGLNRPAALSLLESWNRDKNTPPLPDADISKTVLSVYDRSDRNFKDPMSAVGTEDPDEDSAFKFVKFTEYMEMYNDANVNWCIEGWLPAATIAFVISPPGTYKTWTILDLAVSVADGTPFLNQFPVVDKGPVMILQQEDPNATLAQRLSVIVHERYRMRARPVDSETDGDLAIEFDAPPELPIYHHTERRLRFDDKGMMKAFVRQVEKIRPKLVILDPLYSATSTDDFMAKAAQDMFIFKDLRDKFGTSFLICHHTNKKGDGRERDRAWGSQFLNAFLETGWQFSQRKGGKSIGVRRHFKNAPEPRDVVVDFDVCTDPDNYRYRPTIQEKDEEGDEEFDPAVEAAAKAPKTVEEVQERRARHAALEEALAPPKPPKSPKTLARERAKKEKT